MVRTIPLDPQLAAELVRRRRALGLSQNAVALAAGLSEGAYSKYETLRCPVPPHKRAAIERALSEAEHRRQHVSASQ